MKITPLPDSPSLENLKNRAKALLKSVRAGEAAALDQVGPYFGDPSAIGLQQAQLVIARSHGFSSWTKLKSHIEQGHASAETTEQRANRFLDLAVIGYRPVPEFGTTRFGQAAALLAEHPEIRDHSIYTAAAIGDAERVSRWLDDDPALANQKGGYFGWEPLMYAAYARLPGVSTLQAGLGLLERGADPNPYYMSAGQYKFTALTGVFGQGEGGPIHQPEHPEMVAFARALLERGANPNDSQACYNRCFEPDNTYLELLLGFGLNAQDKNNWSVFEDDKLVPHPGETMRFQMFQAIHRGYLDRVKLLAANGADLNAPDNSYDNRTKGRRPVHAALLLGQKEIALALLEAGAEPVDLDPLDAFEADCMSGNRVGAEGWLRTHPEIKDDLADRQCALLCDAVKLGSVTALDTMIELGLDVNQRDRNTALHDAAFSGEMAMVERLLEAGADTTIRDASYFSPPIGWAMHNGQDAMIARLDTEKMDVFTAATRGNLDELKARLDEDPTRRDMTFAQIRPSPERPCDNDWMTPLVYAVLGGRAEATALLLKRGADPRVTDGGGQSLAQIADDHGTPEIKAMIAKALT